MSVRRAGLAAFGLMLAPTFSFADYHIRSPGEIDQGELEIEHNGDAVFDRRPDQTGATSYTLEIGTGITSWWKAEVELGFDRDPGFNLPTRMTGLVLENTFAFSEPGEYWLDPGFYIEYGQSLTRGSNAGPNALTFGPIASKQIGPTTHTINLFFTRELGPYQTTQGVDFSYAWQSRWDLWPKLSPAVEIYGDMGVIGSTGKFNQQQLLVGPVAVGMVHFDELGIHRPGKIKYELGWLFGATTATPHNVLKWQLEVEFPF